MAATDSISVAASFLVDADAVLIVAGAGMSVGPTADDYGRSFVDNVAFRHFYPEMTFARNSWEASFSPAKPSGWWIHHTHMMSGGAAPSPAYQLLLELLGTKEYFVLTSNVDGQFSHAGFDAECVYTAQGDFRVRQCSLPCSNHATWLGRPTVEALLPQVDRRTMELHGRMPQSWTQCQRCGTSAQRPNLRGGDFFIHTPYQSQQDKLVEFVDKAIRDERKMVVLEIGCGFNTPVVTRLPAESIAREAGAPFIRMNLKDCDVPDVPIAVCLPMDTTDALRRLLAAVQAPNPATQGEKWSERVTDGGQWRQMLRRLQDPARVDKCRSVASWRGTALTAVTIAQDGPSRDSSSKEC